ncbi:unnamed protein product [Cuscuta campestris]|uniref:Tetraspanin n=1 Tax=Cuscuta campestris TaxID=132261 RepID=A0A484KGP2_9ASTE|nr:unnamed protein product [Cuscuta campestris]
MVKLSNDLLVLLNFISLVISIPIIAGGVRLSNQSNSDCERFLDKPLTVLGVFLLLFSLAGVIGACRRVYCLLWIYLVGVLFLILLLLGFTIFAFVVTNKGAGEAVSGRGYKEYRLGDYSHWLQNKVDKNWGSIRSCLEEGKICQKLIDNGNSSNNLMVADNFYKLHLSALQSGCCKPPNDCNFTYVSPTKWIATAAQPIELMMAEPMRPNNTDCDNWSNDPKRLCYSCESCKAGLIDNIKSDWKKVAQLNIILLVILVVVYLLGGCAFHNRHHHTCCCC